MNAFTPHRNIDTSDPANLAARMVQLNGEDEAARRAERYASGTDGAQRRPEVVAYWREVSRCVERESGK